MARAIITLHDNIEQGSPEWLDFRIGKYTGSNAHKLLNGLNDIDYAIAEESKFTGNFWTNRGRLLETQSISLYEKMLGIKVRQTGFVTNSLYPKCLYSPDGLPPNTLLESKSFSKKKHLELINARDQYEIPIKITAQIHYGMVITGLKLAHLTPYNPLFAKKQIENEEGLMVDNPDYDPKKAYKIIPIRYDRDIANNFKRILTAERTANAIAT